MYYIAYVGRSMALQGELLQGQGQSLELGLELRAPSIGIPFVVKLQGLLSKWCPQLECIHFQLHAQLQALPLAPRP